MRAGATDSRRAWGSTAFSGRSALRPYIGGAAGRGRVLYLGRRTRYRLPAGRRAGLTLALEVYACAGAICYLSLIFRRRSCRTCWRRRGR